MKVISKEEERAHYKTVLHGGLVGGTLGLGLGMLGVVVAQRRYPAFRQLTLPFRSFLVTSAGTFGAIVNAESYSNAFHKANNPMNFYKDEAQLAREAAERNFTSMERAQAWGRQNRYKIVFTSWLASMGLALWIVGRDRYLSPPQKVVHARMYAQGLTLAVLIATAALETADAKSGSGRWETIKIIDPNDPEHKNLIEKRIHKEEYEGQDLWMDMVAAEERRLKARKEAEKDQAGSK